ncbi:hypothetical protein BU14_0172s0015 [Porphyra umbilicalis]|uniref:Uncharacterized protein n=1 Tax=Porphyra umbilicalis TaxID=2786 RepID=A0A1X6P879_PORUM|nr:hypothetical protein BU14_0172s0015 [Porphyra umbilicalis]|eukprot:OSX76833.1 hypothetical protein BU14_0172s0015 [Porphyra umbilicalis]
MLAACGPHTARRPHRVRLPQPPADQRHGRVGPRGEVGGPVARVCPRRGVAAQPCPLWTAARLCGRPGGHSPWPGRRAALVQQAGHPFRGGVGLGGVGLGGVGLGDCPGWVRGVPLVLGDGTGPPCGP